MPHLPSLALVAVAGAALLAAGASREPFMPRLVRLEAAAAAPEMADLLVDEPVAVSAVLLEYATDPVLRLNAHLALLRHPRMAREVLPLYGGEPEFREALAEYGPAVLPPIVYFMHHEIRALQVMRAAGEAMAEARRVILWLWGKGNGEPGAASAGDLGPVERGWFAVAFVRDEGHDFLGQFVVDERGEVEWVQTERVTEAAAAFFTSGIRNLETRYRVDGRAAPEDWLWAGVDVALAAGAVKALRVGRAAGSGTRAAAAGARARLAARATVRAGRVALRVGKYGVPVAVAYAVVRHPSLVSGIAAQLAGLAGWPVPLVQGLVWLAVLLPLLLLARVLAGWLVRPALAALRLAIRGALWAERRSRGAG